MRVALINEKGGTGKTTLAVHLAAWLASQGRKHHKVLLVDMDPQGQVGKTLGFPPRLEGPTVSDLLIDANVQPGELVRETDIKNLDVILADKSLARTAEELIGKTGAERVLERKFQSYDGHDVVIFDSPPSLGILTRNILWAAERVVLPVATTYLALDGCAELIQTVQQVQEQAGRETPEVAAIVPTFRRRTRLASEIIERLEQYFPEWLTPSVGNYVAIDEAQSYGQVVWDYKPSNKASKVLADICRDITRKLDLS